MRKKEGYPRVHLPAGIDGRRYSSSLEVRGWRRLAELYENCVWGENPQHRQWSQEHNLRSAMETQYRSGDQQDRLILAVQESVEAHRRERRKREKLD
jgi:hypothetical protein